MDMSYVVLVLLVYLVMYLAPRAGVHSQYRLKKHETFLDARNVTGTRHKDKDTTQVMSML